MCHGEVERAKGAAKSANTMVCGTDRRRCAPATKFGNCDRRVHTKVQLANVHAWLYANVFLMWKALKSVFESELRCVGGEAIRNFRLRAKIDARYAVSGALARLTLDLGPSDESASHRGLHFT